MQFLVSSFATSRSKDKSATSRGEEFRMETPLFFISRARSLPSPQLAVGLASNQMLAWLTLPV